MDPPRPPGRWKSLVGTSAALFLGGVFLVAVYAKMIDPVSFSEVIAIEGLDFLVPAHAMAVAGIVVEAFIGFALVLNIRRGWTLWPTAALVAFFLFLTGRTWIRSLSGDVPAISSCGCFGNLVERSPGQAFWQDALLLAPPAALAFLGRPKDEPAVPPVRAATLALLTTGVLVFTMMAPSLPIDHLATKLREGRAVSEICAGAGEDRMCLGDEALAWFLTEGKHLVVIADLKDEAFAESVGERLDEFFEFLAKDGAPQIWVLYAGKKDDVAAFNFMSRMPPFDYQDAPQAMLRPLYRRLPRTFLVEDGVVTRTWDGLPPLTDLEL